MTELLQAWRQGEEAALDRLMPVVYAELRRLAHAHMRRERPGHALQTTALINEAYLRLVSSGDMRWQNRAHFFAVCAQMMRRILVDIARTDRSRKRGGGERPVTFDETAMAPDDPRIDLAAIDEALTALAAIDARKSRVVELRFFGGLTVGETADVLGIAPETVHRDWKIAKAWLLERLKPA